MPSSTNGTNGKSGYVPPSAFALVRLGLGEDDGTLDWLNRCVEERDALMPWMTFISCLDRLRSDPRFDTLLEGFDDPPQPGRWEGTGSLSY